MKKEKEEVCVHLEGDSWIIQGIFEDRGQALVWCGDCGLEFITPFTRYYMEKYSEDDMKF